MPQAGRQAEKSWHEDLYRSRSQQELVVPPEIKKRYLEPSRWHMFPIDLMFRLLGDVRGKKILSFGCGDESSTVLLALKGAEVWAFDLSHEAMQIQRKLAAANGVTDGLHLAVGAAEELPFAADSFDVVFGSAILHHVPDNLPVVARELARVLKKDGFGVFSEPMVRSPLVRRLRRRLPARQDISPKERPLTEADLEPFSQQFQLEVFPFHILTRFERFLVRGDEALELVSRWRRALVFALAILDSLLLRLPFFHRLAGIVVLKATRKQE